MPETFNTPDENPNRGHQTPLQTSTGSRQHAQAANWSIRRRGLLAIGITAALALSTTALTLTQISETPKPHAATSPTQSVSLHASPSPYPSGTPTRSSTAPGKTTDALAAWANHDPATGRSGTVSGSAGPIIDVVRIPALGAGWAQSVYQGTGPEQLRSGLGHFDGTEVAGQVGNFVLAGHRSGIPAPPLRGIDRIKPGAAIIVSTPERITYTYTVTSVSTVAPTDVAVTAQVPGQPSAMPTKAMLTLITCWPADGHSKRVVVEAALASSRGGLQ
ncbi:MAG: class E sortase [Streptomycetaceae bacterium]|nr:class E sortase [Streptomycetaceae bacterium]